MRSLSHAASHALAAEYVLGALRGRARTRFEAMARTDRQLAEVVRRWEDDLTPLAAAVPAVEPPQRVWKAIEARIGAAPVAAGSDAWKTFGYLASGFAAVLV